MDRLIEGDFLEWIDSEYKNDFYQQQADSLLQAELETLTQDLKDPELTNSQFLFGKESRLDKLLPKDGSLQKLDAIDTKRFNVPGPKHFKKDDAWLMALQNATVQLEYQKLRRINLQLLRDEAEGAYRYWLHSCRELVASCKQRLDKVNGEIDTISKARKSDQLRLKLHLDNIAQKTNAMVATLYQLIYTVAYLQTQMQSSS